MVKMNTLSSATSKQQDPKFIINQWALRDMNRNSFLTSSELMIVSENFANTYVGNTFENTYKKHTLLHTSIYSFVCENNLIMENNVNRS